MIHVTHKVELAIFGGTPVRPQPFPSWPQLLPGDLQALERALNAGTWGGLPEPNTEAAAFTEAFTRRHDSEFGICCLTGTEANRIAMRAAGLRDGGEVILPAYNWVSPVTAVTAAGGSPVLIDTDPETHLMDVGLLEPALTDRTVGVVSMHYGGRIVPPEPILDFCTRHDLFYVEDCAQAHGGAWKGRSVGSHGHAAAFSFQASKLLTCGEGGLVMTSDPRLADAVHAMIDNNRQKPWFLDEVRFPEVSASRITEFQAALLNSQFTVFDERHETRQRNAKLLHDYLDAIDGVSTLRPQPEETNPAYWKFVILLEEPIAKLSKDVFVRALIAEGIPAEPSHVPVHIHPRTVLSRENWTLVSRDEEREATSLPAVEYLAASVHVSLPQNVLLGSADDVADIATAVEKVSRALQGAARGDARELAARNGVWYESPDWSWL